MSFFQQTNFNDTDRLIGGLDVPRSKVDNCRCWYSKFTDFVRHNALVALKCESLFLLKPKMINIQFKNQFYPKNEIEAKKGISMHTFRNIVG